MSYKLGLLLVFTCIVQLYGHQQKFNCIYECIKLYNSNNLYRNIFGDDFVGIYYNNCKINTHNVYNSCSNMCNKNLDRNLVFFKENRENFYL